MYSYGARFYDVALGRFVSADTLIPQPGSPLAWDRYAYANGNPIRYNDPSGHDADCGFHERCKTSTVGGVIRAIEEIYNITISRSASFNLKEMKTIYNAIGTMETGLDALTNGSGLNWINKHFGGTKISRTSSSLAEKMIFDGSAHVGGSTIYLPEKFSESSWLSLDGKAGSMIIHEFGHVFDNRSRSSTGDATIFGGGAGDQLMSFINAKSGNLLGVRAVGGVNYGSNPYVNYDGQWSSESTASYGNNSPADYFANTFAAATTFYEGVPQPSGMWMAAVIDLAQ